MIDIELRFAMRGTTPILQYRKAIYEDKNGKAWEEWDTVPHVFTTEPIKYDEQMLATTNTTHCNC